MLMKSTLLSLVSLFSLSTALPQSSRATASTVKFELNGKSYSLPVLPDFETKLELNKLDVTTAEVIGSNNVECALWSGARFEYVRFGNKNEITFSGSFPNADRVYCWAKNYNSETAVMVEDTKGKQELIPLARVAGTDSAEATLSPALDVKRALPFVLSTNICLFTKAGDTSQAFQGNGPEPAWSRSFMDAKKAICYSVLFR